jgi:glutathione S-transferase
MPRLLAFAPMIDSEFARLLLVHYGVAYTEMDNLFGWASLLTLAHGGFGQVPLLYGDKLHLSGPRSIAEHFDADCAPTLRLFPRSEPERTQLEIDWSSFNGDLAGWTARIAYFHLLPQRAVMVPVFQHNLPAWQRRITGPVYPALRALFTLLLQLKPAIVADSVLRVDSALAVIDRRLAEGRRFLIGDRLTLSDLALATALAPLVLPPAYAARLPPLEAMDETMQALVARVRQRPAGSFVMRIFAHLGAV